jgi:hypothetical protein
VKSIRIALMLAVLAAAAQLRAEFLEMDLSIFGMD